ncbi:D-amino acid aminotransferase [Betaproteobacteria bacterium SCGC AG-212-J23]|nr:D-amino acid aminotransferase [Betaproteobacteria bacterium SCGC AG-212-J23]
MVPVKRDVVFLNGQLLPLDEAKVPVLDRGFIFGDGVYELVPVYSRVAFRLDEHLARLERSLGEAKIRNPYPRARWREIVYQLVDAQSFEDQGVYFQVTRGVARRDHAFPRDAQPTVFMMANPLVNPAREQVDAGGPAVSAQDNRWLRCDIKSISLIGNVLLRQLSAEAGAAETILFRDGKLTEASASNVFIVKRGVIVSPPKSSLILPGITYDVVTELARGNGMPIEFREIPESEVRGADEIWVTSSSKEVLAIVSLDGRSIGDGKPGPVFRRMYELYQEFKRKVMRAGKREALSA